MTTFARPENALKRAEELINVEQKQEALETLHSFITSRRYRAWTRTHEKIMFKYVELCVEMRKGRYAKDGLIQYRGICQQVNVTSLEEVIKHFMHLSTEKAENARNKAQALDEALDVDDLEADKRPEDLMLSCVSGEKGKDRSDCELVTPWFKFLWETYRTVLEILRNNSKLEGLYAMTAHRAFQFCKEYKRTTEFRRLCEIIRNHLANLNKYRDQRDKPDLSLPETLQLYLDTRFEQLKVATELGLWQEAFRSIEDIYGLMCMVKKNPKSALMVVYYSKLSEIFWMSSNHLYHAYARLKLFSLQKSYNKNLNQKDIQLLASSVVLAALSVPPYGGSPSASRLELENENERNLHVANLVAFDVESKSDNRELLSRSSLIMDLVSKGVMTCVTQEVKDLYHALEHEFVPLDLAVKVQPLLAKISKLGGKLLSASSVPEIHLSSYVPSLEKLTALRLLQQVSQVYQTLNIENLSKLIPFFDFSVVEKISVDAVKKHFLSMKIDYQRGAIFFGNKSLESEGLRDHLTTFAEYLSKVKFMVHPAVDKISKLGDAVLDLVEVVEKEHKRLLARKSIIEKRKEDQELQLLKMEREEEAKRLKLHKITEEATQKRLADEFSQMRKERILRELNEREIQEIEVLLENNKIKKPDFDKEKMTKKDLMDLALTKQIREKQVMEKKLQKLAKTMDHLVRAKKEEAIPVIEDMFQRRLSEEKALHALEQQNEIDVSRQRHSGDLEEKRRLGRLLDDKKIFQERVVSSRITEYNRVKEEREGRTNQILESRKQERETKRKMIYFLRTQKRLHEEEEARKLEEMERQKKAEAERKARLDEIAEKKRQREQEVEEKERKRREELLGRSPVVPPRPAETVEAVAPAAPSRPAETVEAVAPAASSSGGRYVPPRLRETAPSAGPSSATDRRSGGGGGNRQSGW